MADDDDKKIDERDELLSRYLESKKPKPLTAEEIEELRNVLNEVRQAQWLRKRIRVGLPWWIAVGGGIFAAVSFVVNWLRPGTLPPGGFPK